MPAQFVLKKGSTGKFRFNLVARNGQVIATSEAYETRAKALAGIESVRKNAADAVLVDGTAPAAKPAAKATTARKGTGTGTAGTAGSTGTAAGGTGGTARRPAAKKAAATVTPADAKGTGGNDPVAKAGKAVKRAAKKVTPGS